MDRDEIEQKIIGIIHDQKTLPPDAVTPDASLREAGIDSLDALNILFALEETFGIAIPDSQAKSIQTLREMTDTVIDLLDQKKA